MSGTNWPTLRGPVGVALKRVAQDAGLTTVLEARLMEIAAGLTYGEIARRHGISINTVKTQARILLESLGACCRHEVGGAVKAAQQRAEAGATPEDLYRFLRLRLE